MAPISPAGRAIPLVVDDGEVLVGVRPADRSHAPRSFVGSRDPAGLAGAAALGDRDSVHLLERLPVGRHQRGRAGGDVAEVGKTGAGDRDRPVDQHVDRRRVAGGDGYAELPDPVEIAAPREFPGHAERGAPAERAEEAQHLGRHPVVGTEVQHPVPFFDAEGVGGRRDVLQQLGEAADDPLGLRGGARGVEDGGDVVVGVERGLRLARPPGELGEETLARAAVPAPQGLPFARRGLSQRAQSEPVLVQHQRRVQRAQDFLHMGAVGVGLHGADGGAVAHRAEIDDQVLQRVARQQRHAVVRAQPARAQRRADAPRHVVHPREGDRAILVDAVDEDLVRKPRGGVFQPREKRMFPWPRRRVRGAGCCLRHGCGVSWVTYSAKGIPGAGRSQARVVAGDTGEERGLAGVGTHDPGHVEPVFLQIVAVPHPVDDGEAGPPGQAASGPRARRRAGNSRPGRARSGRLPADRARRPRRAPRRPGTDRSKAAGTPGCRAGGALPYRASGAGCGSG